MKQKFPKKLFTNFHANRLSGCVGDPNKFSMVPLKDYKALLMAEQGNITQKLRLIYLIELMGYTDVVIDPVFISARFLCGEKPADEWLRDLLEHSNDYRNEAQKRKLKMVKSRLTKTARKHLIKKYQMSADEERAFLEKLEKEGLVE